MHEKKKYIYIYIYRRKENQNEKIKKINYCTLKIRKIKENKTELNIKQLTIKNFILELKTIKNMFEWVFQVKFNLFFKLF